MRGPWPSVKTHCPSPLRQVRWAELLNIKLRIQSVEYTVLLELELAKTEQRKSSQHVSENAFFRVLYTYA